MSLLNRQVAKPTLFKRFSQSGNQLTFSVNFSLSSFRFAAIKHYLCGVLLTVITLTSQSVATEFIVMRLPHGWMIGADSLETGPNGSAKTVCKIQQVHKFVILRYGHSGKTGNPTFNLDEALEKSVSPETTQEGAFRAAREVVDSAMIRMMRAHLHNKEIHYPSTLPDDKFADSVDIAFVLLSIEKDEPKIDNYVAYPGDYTSMQVAHYEERTLTKTKLKYVPAIFSMPDVLDRFPLSRNRLRLERDPAGSIGELLESVGGIGSFGIGPPYVTAKFSDKGLALKVPGQCSN